MNQVSVALVREDVRARTDYGDVNELMQSLTTNGLLEPVGVMINEDNTTYTLLYGGRRMVAVRALRWETVPAVIYPYMPNELDRKTLELVENVHRLDLSWQERSRLTVQIHELMEAKHGKAIRGSDVGWSAKDTAELVGIDVRKVREDVLLQAVITDPDDRKLATELYNEPKRATALKKLYITVKDELTEKAAAKVLARTTLTPEDKQKHMLVDSYIICDVMEGLQAVPDNTYNLVEIDPPYGVDFEASEILSEAKKDVFDSDNFDPLEWLSLVRDVVLESKKKLRSDGWLVLWFALHPWYEAMKEIIVEAGFKPSMPAFWSKPVANARSPLYVFANAVEPFFYCKMPTAQLVKQYASGNVFNFKTTHNRIHPTERPVELMQTLIACFCNPGAKILVPFAGSGNTLLAAANLNCAAVGFDNSERYKGQFANRVISSKIGEYKSYG